MLVPQEVDTHILAMYRVFDVSGVFLMGIIGGTIARQRGFDIIGFFFIAMFSALGGGMIRDVLINQGTVAAMATPEYLILAFAGALIARFVYFKGKLWETIQVHGDAIVSGLWAATGVVKGMTYGLPLLSCLMMGVFTATGGSMIRDVVTGRVPAVFGGAQPTVIPALAAGIIVYASSWIDMLWLGMVIGPIVSIILSVYGYWSGWRVATDPDWAPINEASSQLKTYAQKAEKKGRSVARTLEPAKAREWRHRQMEKALARRMQRQQGQGMSRRESESQAQELRDDLTLEFQAVHKQEEKEQAATHTRQEKPKSSIGFDFGGGSYDNYDEQTGTETTQFEAVTPDTADDTNDTSSMSSEMLDMILADDEMADQLLARLARRYEQKEGKEG